MTPTVEPTPVELERTVTPDTAAADYFREMVASQPDAIALTTTHARFTYADIDRWSDAIASDILAGGPPVEPPVAIVTRDNVALVSAVLAVAKAGRSFVMIDAADPDERIALLLAESGARFCLVDPAHAVPPSVRGLHHVAIRPFRDSAGATPPPRQAPHPRMYVVFTSGTTGKPKGVVTHHHRFVMETIQNSDRHDRRPGDRCTYTALPGFTRAPNNIYGILLSGATMCAFDARSESLAALAAYIARERITLLSLTPSLFRRLIAASPPGLDFTSVRRLRLGADKITPADVEMYKAYFPRPCTLDRGYASTETGAVFQMSIAHDTPVPGPLVPMGHPRPGVEVWLLDDDGNEVRDGDVGELVVRSERVAEGYWNQPELTEERFRIDPDRPGVRKFFTGDLVKREADGLYYFVGRKDSRLKIQGRRTDPSEVEAALLRNPDIHDVAIVGKPDAMGDLRLVAYVVMKPGHSFDPRAIRATLREAAPSWMVPARIHQLDVIPFTRAMKVDRAALVSRVDGDQPEETDASDELERRLVEVWSRVIGCPVHADDDFFDDLGGESVVAAHLVTEVTRLTGRSMHVSLLLELNTVRKMAEYVRGATSAPKLAVLVQAGGPLPPIFCVTGKDGIVLKFRWLAAALGNARPFYGLTFHGFELDAFPTSGATIIACYTEAIRGIQPHGPYYLAGYSGGARKALEIAKLMERQGEEVAFLGFLDAAGNDPPPSLRKRLVNRIDMIRRRPAQDGLGYVRDLFRRPVEFLREQIRDTLTERGLAFPAPIRAANRAHARARRDFLPHTWSGVATLFRARNGLGNLGTLPDLGWSALGAPRLEIADVPGDHNTILTDEVQALATAFNAALERAAAGASPTR